MTTAELEQTTKAVASASTSITMKALVYHGPSERAWDLDDKRLMVAKQFWADAVINSCEGNAAQHVMNLTQGAGVDVAVEAVGIPATFDICQAIVAAGGRIANVGVHGKPVELQIEKLWDCNISITTRLVDTVSNPCC